MEQTAVVEIPDALGGCPEAEIQEAEACWGRLLQAGSDLIRARFDLGGVVFRALQAGQYSDGVVRRLANHLTKVSGKVVSMQVLYESARLYQAFGGSYARIDLMRRQLSFPLTYTYLVRRCVPVVTRETAWNPEEWGHREEGELASLERVVLKIEERFVQDVRRQEESPAVSSDPVSRQSSGFLLACGQSPAFQQASLSVLLAQLQETVGFLERHAFPWSPADDAQWAAFVDRVTRLRVPTDVPMQIAG